MKEKHIKKYMRLAKQVGEDSNPCYSRKIGVVIVDSLGKKIKGTGYNGPPRNTPHCDDPRYLSEVFWPQLTAEEKQQAITASGRISTTEDEDKKCFVECFAGKKMCPRRIVGSPSGKRLELCSCAHAEGNSIVNASSDLDDTHVFCWCPLPCFECTKLLINAGVATIYCTTPDAAYAAGYGSASRFLFDEAKVAVIEHPPEWYLSED